MEYLADYGLAGLFVASFLAATVLPFSSEALLSLLLLNGLDPLKLVLAASVGNWLGGMSSFGLGWLGRWDWIERFLKIKKKSIEKWHGAIQKWGPLLAFFCWMPVIGDLLAIGLGLLRSNPWYTALLMFAGKALRYLVWAWVSGWLGWQLLG